MVGRELLTVSPLGEDHQGHDWDQEVVKEGVGPSHGIMINGLRSWMKVMLTALPALSLIGVWVQGGLLRTNYVLLV